MPERLYKQSAAKNAFLSELIYQHYVEFQEIYGKPQLSVKVKGILGCLELQELPFCYAVTLKKHKKPTKNHCYKATELFSWKYWHSPGYAKNLTQILIILAFGKVWFRDVQDILTRKQLV